MGVTRDRSPAGATVSRAAPPVVRHDRPRTRSAERARTGEAAKTPARGAPSAYRYAVDGWGIGEILVRDGALLEHALPSRQRRLSPDSGGPQGGASTPEVTVPGKRSRERDGFVPDLCRRFADHLHGVPTSYTDVMLDEDVLAPFQRELLAAARSLAWGEVVTYGGLAALAGRPRAARAAGTFCARNRWSLVVPCHRVVAAGRDEPFALGGYGAAGAALKRRLLALEGTLL